MIIWRTIAIRSFLKNMCSVRTRPIPSASNSRAFAASSGVSALARTPVVATSRAHPRSSRNSADSSGSTRGSEPTTTSPVAPLSVMTCPSRTTLRPARNRWFSSSTTTSPAPTTQHLPHPRATTAACEVSPPREVRMPSRDVHARHVLRRRLRAHEDHALPAERPLDGLLGIEDDAAHGGGRVAASPLAIEVYVRLRVDRLDEELVQRRRLDPRRARWPGRSASP